MLLILRLLASDDIFANHSPFPASCSRALQHQRNSRPTTLIQRLRCWPSKRSTPLSQASVSEFLGPPHYRRCTAQWASEWLPAWKNRRAEGRSHQDNGRVLLSEWISLFYADVHCRFSSSCCTGHAARSLRSMSDNAC